MANKHRGSTLDSFLAEENLLNKVKMTAVKRVIAYKLKKDVKKSVIFNQNSLFNR